MTEEERREQRMFPICGCRYCPNAHLRTEIPYCSQSGEEDGNVFDLPLVDGVFPSWCPLEHAPPKEWEEQILDAKSKLIRLERFVRDHVLLPDIEERLKNLSEEKKEAGDP